MNLIEQLGGYGKAKKALIDAQNSNNIDPIIYINDQEVLTDCVCDALIQYRREKNIFEVGDKVVYKGKAGLSGLFEIETLTKTGKPKTVKTKRFGNFPCRYCEVQHATDKEIAQGVRDE